MKKTLIIFVLAIGLLTNIGTGGGDDEAIVYVEPVSVVPRVEDAYFMKDNGAGYERVSWLVPGWFINLEVEVTDSDRDVTTMELRDFYGGKQVGDTAFIDLGQMPGKTSFYSFPEDFQVPINSTPGNWTLKVKIHDAAGHVSPMYTIDYEVAN